MSPLPPRRAGGRPSRPARIALLAILLAAVVAACSGSAAASFDPAGPCVSDGKVAGAYPDLEALIPKTLAGQLPKTLDSGRNCTATQLATLASHGLKEVRFAGAVWPDGSQSGVTLAVFRGAGMQSDWVAEWYEASARAGRTTGNIQVSKPTVSGRPGQRMDLVNGESSQTVITWPSATRDTVNVLIAADEPEDRVQAALAAFT